MSLRDTIEQAFDKTPTPMPPLVSTTYDDEGVTEYFTGTTWRGHSVENLRYHSVAMSFLTPEAHRYYLPAFMIAALDNREEADIIPDHIVYHFSNTDEAFWQERIEKFSPQECGAIIAFIQHFAHEHEPADVQRAIEGLERIIARGQRST